MLPVFLTYPCGHSNRHQVMDQKSSFFICPRVSARFLHGFKGCNGHSDLQNTTKGAEIAGRKITMLCTKIPRGIVRLFAGFSFFWMLAHFCTLFAHRRESRVFPCIVCILCIVSGTCRGKAPPSCWRKTVLSLKSSTGAFIAALRSQTQTLLCKILVGKSQTLSNLHRPGASCAMESLNSTKACWSPDGKKKRQSR